MTQKMNMTPEQGIAVIEFLKHLFNDDVEAYWSTIAQIDQARIYGMYVGYRSLPRAYSPSFRDYVKNHIQPDHAALYEGLRENNPGVSIYVRYTDDGEVSAKAYADTPVTRIGTPPAVSYSITLAADIDIVEGIIRAKWKVRLYKDSLYKSLTREAP